MMPPEHLFYSCILQKTSKIKCIFSTTYCLSTGSKSGKEYIKAVYCHPAYLNYMQSTSCEMPGWIKHKLESSLPGEISIISDMQMAPPLWQNVKRN